MTDKAVTLVKEVAVKWSIINTEGYVSFAFKGNYRNISQPKVRILEEKLDAIAASEGDDETIKNTLLGELEIVN